MDELMLNYIYPDQNKPFVAIRVDSVVNYDEWLNNIVIRSPTVNFFYTTPSTDIEEF